MPLLEQINAAQVSLANHKAKLDGMKNSGYLQDKIVELEESAGGEITEVSKSSFEALQNIFNIVDQIIRLKPEEFTEDQRQEMAGVYNRNLYLVTQAMRLFKAEAPRDLSGISEYLTADINPALNELFNLEDEQDVLEENLLTTLYDHDYKINKEFFFPSVIDVDNEHRVAFEAQKERLDSDSDLQTRLFNFSIKLEILFEKMVLANNSIMKAFASSPDNVAKFRLRLNSDKGLEFAVSNGSSYRVLENVDASSKDSILKEIFDAYKTLHEKRIAPAFKQMESNLKSNELHFDFVYTVSKDID